MHTNQFDYLELKFPAPGRPLSINKANSMHWAAKRRELEPWRDGISFAWKAARPYWWKVKDRKVRVEFELPFPDARRRDPHNYTGTVVKALIDSLTTKSETFKDKEIVVWEGCWPDDTSEWVETVEPKLVQGTEVVVRIYPLQKRPLPEEDSKEDGSWIV